MALFITVSPQITHYSPMFSSNCYSPFAPSIIVVVHPAIELPPFTSNHCVASCCYVASVDAFPPIAMFSHIVLFPPFVVLPPNIAFPCIVMIPCIHSCHLIDLHCPIASHYPSFLGSLVPYLVSFPPLVPLFPVVTLPPVH